MTLCWVLGILVFSYGVFSNGVSKTLPSRPAAVNVGAIFSLNSTIGRVAKIAIDLAVKDVNSDPRVLGGTKLKVMIQDSSCSVFVGIVKGIFFLTIVVNKFALPRSFRIHIPQLTYPNYLL